MPEQPLSSLWVDRLDPHQFEDISNEVQLLGQSIKNVMEFAFAISLLLAISTHGWDTISIHSTCDLSPQSN
jgi:hypothetical protein